MKSRIENLAAVVGKRLAQESTTNPLINCAVSTTLSSPDQVEVLLYGQEMNVRTTELIMGAQQEVLMQFYNFEPQSDSGEDILASLVTLNSLAETRNTQIRVRLLVNKRQGAAAFFTSHGNDSSSWLKEDVSGKYIETENGKVYLPHLDIEVKLHTHQFFDSYHSKQIIVDKKYMMLRSGDISKHSNGRTGERLRMEMATVVESEDVAKFAAASFDQRWHGSEQEFKFLHVGSEGDIPVLLMEKMESTNPVRGLVNQAPMKIALIEGLELADHVVKIITPNINDSDYIEAIIKALKRGVRVEIVLGKFMNDERESKPGMGGTNREAIYKIYESIPVSLWDKFKVRWACNDARELFVDAGTKTMHCKAVIIDNCAVITGSSPLDRQATYFSSECDALIISPAVAEKYLSNIFNPIYALGESFLEENLKLLKYMLVESVKRCGSETGVSDFSQVDALVQAIQAIHSFSELSDIITQMTALPVAGAGASKQGFFAHPLQRKLLAAACAENRIEQGVKGVFVSASRLDF